jgi:His-Xaa-Ser system radical SAM maturase HxsC
MQRYSGVPTNLNQPIMAKVSKGFLADRFHKDSVLVAETLPRLSVGYKAILCAGKNTSERLKNMALPTVCEIPGVENLDEGDIVLMEPNGLVSVLYKKSSSDNTILLTESCNARCLMCSQPAGNNGFSLADLRQFIGLIDRETTNLGITGGEPTIERSKLLQVVALCKEHLPNTEIDLLTNGTLLSDFDYVKEIVSIGHPNLIFQIPLYADTDSCHDNIVATNGFYRTIKGLYNLALFSQKIEIRTVIFSLNYKRLPQLSEFIYRNFPFAFHIALMGLEVIHQARQNAEMLWLDPYLYQDELLEAVRILHRADMNVSIYNHPLCVIPKSLWRFARRSISDWKRRFPEICKSCEAQPLCGGVFATSGEHFSKFLHPVGTP